jgi:hypothetical protein
MKLNPGVGYTSANLGEASGITVDAPFESSARNIGRQFECSITGAKVGESYEYRLHVRKGLVEFDYYLSDENGIIDLENLGGISGRKCQNMFFYMNKFNVFPEGSRTEGTDEKSEFFSKNGFIKLTTGKNYFVFLYKTTPDWKDSDDLWEAKAPQIGISGDVDEPNNFIRTQRNGGGFLQSYLRLDGAGTFDNVVTADGTTGQIANFDASYLNPSVIFNTDLIEVVLKKGSISSDGLTWLSGNIPVFAKASTQPGYGNANGNTIDGVPYGFNWLTNGSGDGPFIVNIDGSRGYYPTAGDIGNYVAIGVIKYAYNSDWNIISSTFGSKVTGVVDPHFIELKAPDKVPGVNQGIVEFENSDIPIVADHVTTIKTPGEMTDEGTGYVYTDCYRQDIAYIEWNAALNRFQIYQMQYGPIKLRQNPLGSFKNKLLTSSSQIAKWGTDFDLCSDITGNFSGYTKDLNHAYYVPPAPAEQIPAYAGQIAIGEYQTPKETL